MRNDEVSTEYYSKDSMTIDAWDAHFLLYLIRLLCYLTASIEHPNILNLMNNPNHTSLISERGNEVSQRVNALGRKFLAVLPLFLTRETLLHFERHPDDFLTRTLRPLDNTSSLSHITRAREFIEAHLTETLPLSRISEATGISEFYLCKLFKSVEQVNITDFVSKRRIEKAQELLIKPASRVKEISFAVGFGSVNHFCRVFRKVTGEAPTEYRKRIRRLAPESAN